MITLEQRISNIESQIRMFKSKLNDLYDYNEHLKDDEFLELEEYYNNNVRELEGILYDLEFEVESNELDIQFQLQYQQSYK